MELISRKPVPCTSCGGPVEIYRLRWHPEPTKEFPNGFYRGRCPRCGAIFDYEGGYIKQVIKDGD